MGCRICFELFILPTLFFLLRPSHLESEAPSHAQQLLKDLPLPETTSQQLASSKTSHEKLETSEKPKILYDLDAEEPMTTIPVKAPQPTNEKAMRSRSSSSSSVSSRSRSGSSSDSRSPPKKRASSDSDADAKKEKKVVEVSSLLQATLVASSGLSPLHC